MSEDLRNLTCEEFQNQIAELVGSGAKIENHPHLKVCAICSQLLNDLTTMQKTRDIFGSVPRSPIQTTGRRPHRS